MRISSYFQLEKTQPLLDFVDIYVDTDIPLFIDPYALKAREDTWSKKCNNKVVDFFETVLLSLRQENDDYAKQLLNNLKEPKETHLGHSRDSITGRGVSGKQAFDLFTALKGSRAVQTGVLRDLSDCELMIRGISYDKISDITTNIIRENLIEYTQEQCALHNIPMHERPSGLLWSEQNRRWENGHYVQLPVVGVQTIILVPKHIVVYRPAITANEFYTHEVLDYICAEFLNANSALVEVLKNGRRRVTKKSVKEQPEYRMSKEFLYAFCNRHPEVLQNYKDRKAQEGIKIQEFDDYNEAEIARVLIDGLNRIPAGAENASRYHNYCIGLLEFLFFPYLMYPKKEQEINQGRKRIDITMQNNASEGFFSMLLQTPNIAAMTIMIECKNYTNDIQNPELDQLSGRFSHLRGKFGMLLSRNFDDREQFIQRCRDTAHDDRGIIMPLVDEDLISLLKMIEHGQRNSILLFLNDLFNRIIN